MNTTKVKITKIYTTNVDKNKQPLVSKTGKNYTRMSIKCEQYGEKWVSGFQNASNKDWKEGDEVEVIIKQNGEYLNFETIKKDDKITDMLSQILTKVGKIDAKLDLIADGINLREKLQEKYKGDNSGIDYPDEDINPEDIPF